LAPAALLDAAVPGLVLVQAIGRLAYVITGDAMGKATNGPFGLTQSQIVALVMLAVAVPLIVCSHMQRHHAFIAR